MTLISESEYSSLQYVANTIRAERDAAREELNDCRDALQDWQVAAGMQKAERDAARADCATLHKMLDETVSERDAALRNYQNARIVYEVVIDERDVARAEADALRKEHDEIIEELDTYGWWMDNPNMLERLKFALATSQEKSDDLANMQLAMRSTRQTE